MTEVKDALEVLADVAEILTAVIASIAYVYYWRIKRTKMSMLLDVLKRDASPGSGSRSLKHVQMFTGMSEAEVLEASFQSKFIKRHQRNHETTGQTEEIRYEYDPTGLQPRQLSIWRDAVPVPFWLLIVIAIALIAWVTFKNSPLIQ